MVQHQSGKNSDSQTDSWGSVTMGCVVSHQREKPLVWTTTNKQSHHFACNANYISPLTETHASLLSFSSTVSHTAASGGQDQGKAITVALKKTLIVSEYGVGEVFLDRLAYEGYT